MKKLSLTSLFVSALVAIPMVSNAKTESVDTIKISDNIHFMRVNSSMGNTSSVVSIGPDGVLLIDPNFDGSAKFIKQNIKTLGGGEVTYVTSTHVHRDHTEQYPEFLETAIGIMPEQQRIELAGEDFMQGKLPAITFKGSTTLHFNNDTIKLSTLPTKIGHTNGDLVAHFEKAKVLYVGDYLFVNGYPIIDKTLGDLKGYLANINYMLATYPSDTKVLGGHTSFDGAPFNAISMKDYQRYYDDLVASIEYIQAQKKAGKTMEQLIEAGMPVRYSRFKQQPTFIKEKRWIEYIYPTQLE